MNWLKLKLKQQEQPRDSNEKSVIDTGVLYPVNCIPFFSVCIPTYNRASMLPAAIESVLAQDFENFELIICDNASTDNTEAVVTGYNARRIRYVRYANLVSMYANHNRCCDLARGNWLLFLHSDDKLSSNALYKLKNLVSAPATKDLVIIAPFISFPVYLHHLLPQTKDFVYLDSNYGLLDILVVHNGISPSGCCFKTAYIKCNYFDEVGITADRTCIVLALLNGNKILLSREEIIYISKHQMSYSSSADKNGDWHIGLARTTKLVTEHPEWRNYQTAVANYLKHCSKRTQLDFLIRLAQARKWRVFFEIVPVMSIRCFLSLRIIHILAVFALGKNYWFFLKSFIRMKYFFSQSYVLRLTIGNIR